jgi:hypothetical protein
VRNARPSLTHRLPQTSAEVDKALDQLIDRYVAHRLVDGDGLFHYTPMAGFRGIVSSREMWAVAHNNAEKDGFEGRHAEPIVIGVLDELGASPGFAAEVARRIPRIHVS